MVPGPLAECDVQVAVDPLVGEEGDLGNLPGLGVGQEHPPGGVGELNRGTREGRERNRGIRGRMRMEEEEKERGKGE